VIGGEACNAYAPDDTANFLAFAQALRAAHPGLVLSAAAGILPWKDAGGTPSADVSAFAHALDWVALMNYDEFGQWSASAGPNAALDDACAPGPAQQGSAASAVAAWTAAGMPAGQLVLGVASYGHAFNVTKRAALAGGSKVALFPAYEKWNVAPGEAAPTECGQPVAKDVQYTFAELVQYGYLNADGTAAAQIDSVYDECSQTVRGPPCAISRALTGLRPSRSCTTSLRRRSSRTTTRARLQPRASSSRTRGSAALRCGRRRGTTRTSCSTPSARRSVCHRTVVAFMCLCTTFIYLASWLVGTWGWLLAPHFSVVNLDPMPYMTNIANE
jgi:hypothetical protein